MADTKMFVAQAPASTPAADLSFLLGWARAPERWRELLEAIDHGQVVETPPAEPDLDVVVGVAVVGQDGAISAANAPGRLACDQRLGLVESRGQNFLTPANHEAVDQARRELLARGGGQLVVKLTHHDNDGGVFVYACLADALPAHLAGGLGARREGDLALVFPPSESADLLAASLRTSFGLTPAETRLANLLREGLSLQETAEELGVSVNTTRNQLRAIFEKMGLNRQAELVRALSQLSSLVNVLPAGGIGLGSPEFAAAGGALKTAPPIRLFRLADGRNLSWRDYGDKDGRPVLIVHQGLGGSLFPRGTDALARDLGLRLIVPARPGVGVSDPRPRYSYDGVAADMIELLDDLGVERVQVASVVDGAPYAIATAGLLGRRAERVIMVGPRPPGWRTSVQRELVHPLLQFRRRLASNPWLADVVYSLVRRELTRRGIERFVQVGASATPVDAAYLAAHPDLLAYSVEYVTDAFLPSARGIIDSTKCAARSPAPDPGRLKAPLTVWLGEEDPMLTQEEARAWLGERLGTLRIFPGAGNFLAYSAWPQMLAWLAD